MKMPAAASSAPIGRAPTSRTATQPACSDELTSSLGSACKSSGNNGSTVASAATALQQLVASRSELLQGGVDGDWEVAWSGADAAALAHAVERLVAALDRGGSAGGNASADRALLTVAADGSAWLPQLAELALAVKASWDGLGARAQAQDGAPPALMRCLGLLLARTAASAAAAGAAASSKAAAAAVLRQLAGASCQRALHASVACWVARFKGGEPAAASRAPLADGTIGHTRPPACAADQPGAAFSAAQRLLASEFVPHVHAALAGGAGRAPQAAEQVEWQAAQEVLACWCSTVRRAERLGLPVPVSPGVFMLAVEALWLLAQPSGAYTSTSAPSAEPPLALWSALLVKLLAALEASLTGDGAGDAAASSAEPEPAACEPLSGEEVQREVVGAAGPLLLAMLAEALQQLRDAWSAEPGGARAALLRDTVAESDAPAAARQRRLAALLGKAGQGKPRGSEVACGQLLLMVKQLAVLLAELLQLERSACGGPGRDGTVLLTEAGAEAVWFSCLWRSQPRSLCAVAELLLRCPCPASQATTTLLELLLDDAWEAAKELPLLQQPDTARAFAAMGASCRKLVMLWQLAVKQALAAGAAAAGACAPTDGSSKAQGRHQQDGGKRSSASKAKAQAAAPAAAAVGAGEGRPAVAAAPAWLVAVAEADLQQAVRACMALLCRTLDNAQKAFHWRWYLWWEQQQPSAGLLPCLPSSSGATGFDGASSISSDWSDASGSFLSSSGSAACGDGGSGSSGCCGEPAAAALASADPAALAWADTGVQLALGFTALAGPAFGFVHGIIAASTAGLAEPQRRQQSERLLALLAPVSDGLAANTLLLAELQRLGLLPAFPRGAAAASAQLATALTDLAAAGSGGQPPPPPGAPLAEYDAWWQSLVLPAAGQLRVSAVLAGLVVPPLLVAGVGCRNPGCVNIGSDSEQALPTRVCQRCFVVAYCSNACAASFWREGGGYSHRAECKDLQC